MANIDNFNDFTTGPVIEMNEKDDQNCIQIAV